MNASIRKAEAALAAAADLSRPVLLDVEVYATLVGHAVRDYDATRARCGAHWTAANLRILTRGLVTATADQLRVEAGGSMRVMPTAEQLRAWSYGSKGGAR